MGDVANLIWDNSIGVAVKPINEFLDKPRKDAETATQKIQENQNKLEDDLKKKQASEDATMTRDLARTRQKSLAAGAQGRRSTLLTGYLGVPDTANNTKKTLLGM